MKSIKTTSYTKGVKMPADYYERQEARRQRIMERLEKAQESARSEHDASLRELSQIPLGQPILVGHYSERSHRALLARSDRHMEKSVELTRKADYLSDKLHGVGHGGISSDAPDAIELLEAKLASLVARQESMKAANKAAGYGNPKPYAPFQLSNNNANIRRIRQRLEHLKKHAADVTTRLPFEGGEIVDNVEENRVQILFDEKPSCEVRAELKSYGFRWAPRFSAWQKMRSRWAMYEARKVCGIDA